MKFMIVIKRKILSITNRCTYETMLNFSPFCVVTRGCNRMTDNGIIPQSLGMEIISCSKTCFLSQRFIIKIWKWKKASIGRRNQAIFWYMNIMHQWKKRKSSVQNSFLRWAFRLRIVEKNYHRKVATSGHKEKIHIRLYLIM